MNKELIEKFEKAYNNYSKSHSKWRQGSYLYSDELLEIYEDFVTELQPLLPKIIKALKTS